MKFWHEDDIIAISVISVIIICVGALIIDFADMPDTDPPIEPIDDEQVQKDTNRGLFIMVTGIILFVISLIVHYKQRKNVSERVMKYLENTNPFGLTYDKQHLISLVLLSINSIFCAIIWILARFESDSITAVVGFLFFMNSLLSLLLLLKKKYELTIFLTILGVWFSGVLLFAFISSVVTYSHELDYSINEISEILDILIALIAFPCFSISGYFTYNLYRGIVVPKIRASLTPKARRRLKRQTKVGTFSVIVGFLGLYVSLLYPPIGIGIGGMAFAFGLYARGKRDKNGLAGIWLGIACMALGLFMILYYFTYGNHTFPW